MTKKDKAKKFYIEDDKSVADIAVALNINKNTVYYYKNSDFKKGIDWDELRYISTLNPEDTQDKEKIFLSVLIKEFDKALVDLAKSDIEKKLLKLESFARTYYKLKIPDNKTDVKVQKTQIIKEVITKLANLSIELNQKQVAQFLSDNADRILQDLLKNA